MIQPLRLLLRHAKSLFGYVGHIDMDEDSVYCGRRWRAI